MQSSQHPYELDIVIIHILPKKNLRNREDYEVSQITWLLLSRVKVYQFKCGAQWFNHYIVLSVLCMLAMPVSFHILAAGF